jgi:hypothetical protein
VHCNIFVRRTMTFCPSANHRSTFRLPVLFCGDARLPVAVHAGTGFFCILRMLLAWFMVPAMEITSEAAPDRKT